MNYNMLKIIGVRNDTFYGDIVLIVENQENNLRSLYYYDEYWDELRTDSDYKLSTRICLGIDEVIEFIKKYGNDDIRLKFEEYILKKIT